MESKPESNGRETIRVKLPDDLCNEIEEIAAKSGMSFSEFVVTACRNTVEELKTQEKPGK